MSTQKQCSQCGNTFEATQSGCPACQIRMGLETHSTRVTDVCVPEISVEELSEKFEDLDILEVIGVGGMGAVYRVRQKKLDRIVALKIIRPDISETGEFLQRFEREAKAMARLNHPNIVSIYDFGTQNDICYYLMELVDGPDLSELCKSESLSPNESLEIVTQVCRAMQYAHDNGVVHRDIKPTNILLNRDGVVKIADFGLAKLCASDEPTTQLTQTQQVFGTPRYMAPEQIEATREVDHRADIYSLGVVFYELLTGELPLGRFDPPSEKIQVDVRLDEVVLRALEKHPERRYQAAHEFQTDISRIVQPVPPVKSTEYKNAAQPIVPEADSVRPPWPVAALLVPGSLLTALGAYFFASGLSVGFFEQNDSMLYSSMSLMFGTLLLFLTGAVFMIGGWAYWYRVDETPPLQSSPSPVRRLLNYRSLIYLAIVGALLTAALPWYEFSISPSAESLGNRNPAVNYVFAHEMWIGFGTAAAVILFLPLLVFIDVYEKQRAYFSVAQFILGVALINVVMAVHQLPASYLLPKEDVIPELLGNVRGGSHVLLTVDLLGGFAAILMTTAVLRVIVLIVQRVWSEPFRKTTGEVLTSSGTRFVRWSRAFVEWIRNLS